MDRLSSTGSCTFLSGNLIAWHKKQDVVARFSCVLESRALARDICEVLWIKNLLVIDENDHALSNSTFLISNLLLV